MLVLSRKSGEVIRIGESVKLTVLRVQGNRVHLGIEAPDSVQVHRTEIYFDATPDRTAVAAPCPR